VIVKHRAKVVEVQVRTSLQQAWAELSEKLSDVIDPAIKYGRGDKSFMEPLMKSSGVVAKEEAKEAKLANLEREVSVLLSQGSLSPEQRRKRSVCGKT
jgi:ppGpp synthetase/RelA/SpoT-type nucleotidyltranferase